MAIRMVFGNSSISSATVPESLQFIIDLECAAVTPLHDVIHMHIVAIRNGVDNSSLQRGGNTCKHAAILLAGSTPLQFYEWYERAPRATGSCLLEV